MTLEQLAAQHGTDKLVHSYCPHYELRFGRRRDDVRTLLEIGVMSGASLRMWRDYFPAAHIFGIDAVQESVFHEERLDVFLGRQEHIPFLRSVAERTGPLDIVIDDGSHCGVHHVITWRVLWEHVSPGGWYCIEDCQSLFNECWTQPGDKTMLDVLSRYWEPICRGKGDIAEVNVIGDGINDGLICIRKRAIPEEGRRCFPWP